MFEKNFISHLKQVNVSVDKDKTGANVKLLWDAASKEDKDKIMNLSGLTPWSIQRVCKIGTISCKLIVAMTQVLDVSADFLIGRSDERGAYSEEALREFLVSQKYEKLLSGGSDDGKAKVGRKAGVRKGVKAVGRPRKKAKAESASEDGSDAASDVTPKRKYVKRKDRMLAGLGMGADAGSDGYAAEPKAVRVSKGAGELRFGALSKRVRISDELQSKLDLMTEDDMVLLLKGIMLRAKAGVAVELSNTIKRLLLM
ncbi:MAG: hypothetical protein FWE70_08380 [Oscillospiraceae bacterium]|nr:hypothetical protein [Oscillospiraceae bacterium]